MSAAPTQLTFDLPHRAALGAEDFLISPSNQAAADMIDRWPALAPVVGRGGGALARRQDAPRQRVAPEVGRGAAGGARHRRSRRCIAAAAGRAVLVEDLHAGIGDERALFHLLNLVREHKLSMLLTSRTPPGEISAGLPDLRSRLRALPVVVIAPPDEALLKAVLVKHFTDRQLAVEPHLVAYIALRMERSMEAAAPSSPRSTGRRWPRTAR